MKKIFLSLSFSFALFVFSSNAIGCIVGYFATQVSIDVGYEIALNECATTLADVDCFQDAYDHHKRLSAIKLAVLIACCGTKFPAC